MKARVITEEDIERVSREDFVTPEGRINNMYEHEILIAHEAAKSGSLKKAIKRVKTCNTPAVLKQRTAEFRRNRLFLAYLERLLREGNLVKKVYEVREDALAAETKDGRPDHRIRLKAADSIEQLWWEVEDRLDARPQNQEEYETWELIMESLEDEDERILEWAYKHGRLPGDNVRRRLLSDGKEEKEPE